ncbi:GNAT family N-acetyltransferase [Arthrobacter castelli]|uniref:GNAT family N-acetyltransferase n=1 Tax=Arthrobacter castelli TaxID=271431 RepID=UPI0003F7A2CC|nr:GNAT family protein [Arthrobacter castelli]
MKDDGVITLRRLRVDDAEAFAALAADADASAPVSRPNGRPDYSAADAALFIASEVAEGWRTGHTLRWAVVDRACDRLLGTVALHKVDTSGAEMGIRMSAAARGQGHGHRAVELVLEYAFDHLRLSVVHWYAKVGNWASRNLAHRAGFVLEGTVRALASADGPRADCWILTLTAADYRIVTAAAGAPADGGDLAAGIPAVVPVLCDGTIRLRQLAGADVMPLTANCQDPAAVRWTTIPENYTEEDARNYIFGHVPACWANGSEQNFAVADAASDQLLGTIGLHRFQAGTAEVGINIGAGARGSGAAERAGRLLIDYAFEQLNLQYLYWQAAVSNWASRKLAWKLGFRHEGTIRGYFVQRGVPTDVWLLSLASTDPRHRRAPWDGAHLPRLDQP